MRARLACGIAAPLHQLETAMSRIVIFLYGTLSYLIGLVSFVYGLGFIGGFVTPTALDAAPTRPLGHALGVDLGLIAAFAVQHSGMARPSFKRWWTRFVPESIERSTYVLVSSLAMAAIYILWQPIGGVVWSAGRGAARDAVIGLYLFGWALLFYSTFLIDHFDLLGLKQVWRRLRGKDYVAPQFHTPSLYKLVRHPLYIGWLIIFWVAPVMTIAHFIFALMTTVYILVAIRFEERDLVQAFGEEYVSYRSQTGMLVPKIRLRSTIVKAAARR
jgi:methanethiol S-methyltransferase